MYFNVRSCFYTTSVLVFAVDQIFAVQYTSLIIQNVFRYQTKLDFRARALT